MDTTHTGSFVNALYGSANQADPQVGDGATVLGWTDRHAATIVEVSNNGKTIVIQEDDAKRVDSNGMSESQTYEFTPNPNAPRKTYTRRKNGQYVRQGDPMKGGGRILVGRRDHYYDFSF